MVQVGGLKTNWTRKITVGFLAGLLMLAATKTARASGPNEAVLDATALAQMETKADQADPREQVFLYTSVLHGLTEMAGRQIAAGDEENASKTVSRIDRIVAKVQLVTSRNAKHLKDAEELLEHTARRLSDMARLTSGEERSLMQATLQKLNHVHTDVLAMVFAR